MPINILILGGSRYYVKGIQTLVKNGYRVLCLDKNPDSPAFQYATASFPWDISDTSAVLKIAEEHGVNAIVPLNDYGVLTAAHVSQKMGLIGLAPETAKRACYKALMRACWQKSHLPQPEFAIAKNKNDILAAIDGIGLPCVLKPGMGAGGASRGVIVVENAAEIAAAVEFTLGFYADQTTLVEKFAATRSEHSAEVLVTKDFARVIAIGDKIKTPLPYRVDKSVLYPTALSEQEQKQVSRTLADAILAVGIVVGAVHVEFGMTANGPVLFELGARCGGGGTPDPIVPQVTGIDYFVSYVKILCGEKISLPKQPAQRGCCYHFLTPPPGKLVEVKGLEDVQRLSGVLDADVLRKPGNEILPVRTGPDRAGFVITAAPTREEAYRLAVECERQIVFEYS